MRPKQLISTLLLSILSLNFYSQRVLRRDNPMLFKMWKETAQFLKTRDTAGLRRVCLDSLEFSYSDFGTGTHRKKLRSFSGFIKVELDSLVHDEIFLKAISRKKAGLIEASIYDKDANKEILYMTEYRFRNRKRGKKRYNYVQVICFSYLFLEGQYKLFGIGDGA